MSQELGLTAMDYGLGSAIFFISYSIFQVRQNSRHAQQHTMQGSPDTDSTAHTGTCRPPMRAPATYASTLSVYAASLRMCRSPATWRSFTWVAP